MSLNFLNCIGGLCMKGKISANCQHFTGKKKPFSSVKRHVIREPQEPHKNKYAKFSKIS